MIRRAIAAVLAAFLLGAAAGAAAQSFKPFVVKDIRAEGLQRTEPGTVFSYLPVKVGETMNEEKAQQARHKLDGWKQAFRLDKRLLYKLDRPENDAGEAGSKPEPVEKPAPAAKSQAKTAANPKAKTAAKASKPAAEKSASATNGKVALLVRLYFSSHEKLSEQRWLERIPSEEPFKSASPKVVHHSDPEFESTDQKFEALE